MFIRSIVDSGLAGLVLPRHGMGVGCVEECYI